MNNYPEVVTERFDGANFHINYCLKFMKKYLKGNVLEIGAGCGSFTRNYINEEIFSLTLTDTDDKNILILKNKYKNNPKIKITQQNINNIEQKFDTIIYLHVLEHIKNDKKEIKKAYKALKKNGRLIINVPAFQHLYSKFDEDVGHFKRYNKNQILSLCKSLKINNIDMKYYDSIGYFLSFLSKLVVSDYKKNFRKKIEFWNSLIFLSRIVDFFTMNFFGKSLIVIPGLSSR